MKTLWNFILLVGLLCLAGCSKEEPQSVALSLTIYDKENSMGEILDVQVTANCLWTVSDDSELVKTSMQQNEDFSGSIRIFIEGNLSYDDLTHTVTVTSEDGSSVSTLTIKHPSSPGLLFESIDMIPEEGGSFDVPVQANDNIVSIETPDWVSHTSSRGLVGHVYTFTVGPNKSGSVRSGSIRIVTDRTSGNMHVQQDSYTPTGIIVEDLPKYTFPQTIKRSVQVLPEYADITKLELSATGKCDVSLEKGTLSVNMHSYGVHSVKILLDGSCIKEMTTECLPKQPGYINEDMAGDMIREEELSPTMFYKKSDYIISSDRPDVVSVTGNGNIKAVSPGSANILIEHKEAKWSRAGFKVTVQPFRLTAKVHKAEHVYGNKYEVSFYAKAVGNKFTSFPEFYVQDTDGTQYLKGQGHVLSSSYINEITTGTLIVDTGDNYTLSSIISRLKFCVSVEVEGAKYSKGVKISWE